MIATLFAPFFTVTFIVLFAILIGWGIAKGLNWLFCWILQANEHDHDDHF